MATVGAPWLTNRAGILRMAVSRDRLSARDARRCGERRAPDGSFSRGQARLAARPEADLSA